MMGNDRGGSIQVGLSNHCITMDERMTNDQK